MFDETTIAAITDIAEGLNVQPAALLAVVEVESGGRAFADVDGRQEPLIRFEGHYFDRHLDGLARRRARRMGLASPKAGVVKNPRKQADRWDMLARAAAIDRAAAYASVSWGVGQVMGSHWTWLGYDSVEALVAAARGGLGGQVALMARYIEKADLASALRDRDWAAFARGYNGPAYARNRYDTRMAQAHGRWVERLGAPSFRDGVVDLGARGPAVRTLQDDLRKHGHIVVADGIFGLRTQKALRAFQTRVGLEPTGRAGAPDLRALARVERGRPAPELGNWVGRVTAALVSLGLTLWRRRA